MNKITLEIHQDLDGFLGYDSSTIDMIDVEASQASYEKRVLKLLAEWLPEYSFEFVWDQNNNYSLHQIDDPSEEMTVQDMMEMAVDQVYNMQDFWVDK
jgi:hypothetical protein